MPKPLDLHAELPLAAQAPWVDPRQQERLSFLRVECAVHGLFLAAQLVAMALGEVEARLAWMFVLPQLPVMLGTYLYMHSGRNLRLADPAMTLPRMVFSILMLAVAYALNPKARGMLLMVLPMIQILAAFTLPPRASVRLAVLVLIVFGSVMLGAALLDPQRFDPQLEGFHFVFTLATVSAVGWLAAKLSDMRAHLQRQRSELSGALWRIQLLATRDDLTGLFNRRHMEELSLLEFKRSQRMRAPLCLCLLDIDHFKRLNDSLGHAVGDEALRLFARQVSASLRETDVLARWGGEEFLLMLPDTRPDEARMSIERLRRALAREGSWEGKTHLRCSFSAGLVLWREEEDLADALKRADAALYMAKAAGRDRTVQG